MCSKQGRASQESPKRDPCKKLILDWNEEQKLYIWAKGVAVQETTDSGSNPNCTPVKTKKDGSSSMYFYDKHTSPNLIWVQIYISLISLMTS